jgi:hypothetical protein
MNDKHKFLYCVLRETTAFERSFEGENDQLKPHNWVEDLLVLEARALIVIGLGSPSFPRGKLVASSYSKAFPSSKFTFGDILNPQAKGWKYGLPWKELRR